jgi:hypothetical protein
LFMKFQINIYEVICASWNLIVAKFTSKWSVTKLPY